MFKIFLMVIACLFITACKSFQEKSMDRTARMLNPVKLHVAAETGSEAYVAEKIPADDYYKSMKLASQKYLESGNNISSFTTSEQKNIANYVEEGIGLVDTYCRRWFQSMDDMGRLLAYQNKNVNIITQFGTTALGIGGASASAVASYGAITATALGLSSNIDSSFLVVPNSERVKEHIEKLLNDEAKNLRLEKNSITFKAAYVRLEKYADICTHSRAKAIVDEALEKTKSRLNVETGQPEVAI